MHDLRDGMLKPLEAGKNGLQSAMDKVAPRQAYGVVIHVGDIYELQDKKGQVFRLRVYNILSRNRIMMKLI